MTTDVERLLGWFADGTLWRPDPAAPNTVDLCRALAKLCGADLQRLGFDGPSAQRVAELIGPSEHLVFVLVDGLGTALLERLEPDGFFRSHLALDLRSVFPSATASAVTALATGEWPARHGVPGWWTFLPEHDLTVVSLPFVERFGGQPLVERGLTPAEVYPAPPILDAYRRDALLLQPAFISDSAYSNYSRGTVPSAGYEGLAQGVDMALARAREAGGPTYTYLYIPTIDALSHEHGPDAEEVLVHTRTVEAELARLAGGLRALGDFRLVASADHGLVTVPPERKHLLPADDPLLASLRIPPTGEPRCPFFHVREGQLAAFAAAFRTRFGEEYVLLTTDEVEELALLGPGPLGARTRERIGDFLAVAGDRQVLLYRANADPDGVEGLRGYHGGLLADEVRVPLIVAR